MQRCAWVIGIGVLMLAGCSSARLVDTTPDGGCVAIADNSDSWPSYNMTKARDLMNKQCPGGYKIVRQKEFVTGQTTTNNTEQDTKEVPLVKGLVVDVKQSTRNTTTVRDQTEWRIWYQKN